MKFRYATTFKVIAGTALAIAAAVFVRCAYNSVAAPSGGGSLSSLYEDELLVARNMFIEKADDIQAITAELIKGPPLAVLRSEDGLPLLEEGGTAAGELTFEDAGIQASLDRVFGAYDCGGSILNIKVTDDAVLYYTYYNGGCCVGFLYEKEAGSTSYYGYFELVENWKLFYSLPA